MARKSLPTVQTKVAPSLDQIILREGYQYMSFATYNGINPSGNTLLGSPMSNFGLAKKAVRVKLTITSSALVQLATGGQYDDSGFWINNFTSFYVQPGSSQILEYDSMQPNILPGFTLFGGDNVSQVSVTISASYKIITNDSQFDADRTIGWIGDSISEPTTNSNLTKNDYHHFKVKNWFQEFSPSKETFRLTITAAGGRQSNSYQSLLERGGSGSKPVNLSLDFYQMGMNDSGQSLGTSVYKSNIKKWMYDRRITYPGIVLVCLGTTPAQQTLRNNNLDAYRTAMAECVLEEKALYTSLGLNPEKIIGIDLSKSFDRTISSRYATSDGAGGDALHPGDVTANLQMFNKICEGVDFDTPNGQLGVNFGGLLPAGGLRQRNIFNLLP